MAITFKGITSTSASASALTGPIFTEETDDRLYWVFYFAVAGTMSDVTADTASMTRVTPSESRRFHLFYIDDPNSEADLDVGTSNPGNNQVIAAAIVFGNGAGTNEQLKEVSGTVDGLPEEVTATFDSSTASGNTLLAFSLAYGTNTHNHGVPSSWETNGSAGPTEALNLGDSGSGDDVRAGLAYDIGAATGSTDSMSVTMGPGSGGDDTGTLAILELSEAGGGAQAITPAAVTVTVTPGTLTVTPGAVDITPAALTVTVTPGTLTITASYDITPDPVTVNVTPGTVTITTGAVDITPAALTVTVTPGTLSVTPPPQDITPAPVTVTVTAGTATITTSYDITPGATTVTVSAGSVTVANVGGGTQDITPAATTVTATAGTLTLAIDIAPTGASVTVTPGTVSLSIDVALAGASVTVTAGTVALDMNVALSVAAVSVTAGTLTVPTTAQDVTPGAVTVAVTAGTVSVQSIGQPVRYQRHPAIGVPRHPATGVPRRLAAARPGRHL